MLTISSMTSLLYLRVAVVALVMPAAVVLRWPAVETMVWLSSQFHLRIIILLHVFSEGAFKTQQKSRRLTADGG